MIGLIFSLGLVAVDIKGEINNPGVYYIEAGTISNVIDLAGGLTSDADTEFINLARGVTDEMVIYIPNINARDKGNISCNCQPVICLPQVARTRPPAQTTTKKVTEPTTSIPAPTIININKATLEELITLRGIGEVIAQRILAFREATPFVTIEDILKVTGIGEVIFAQIKDYITV